MSQLPILAVAFGIYIVGIAIILYIRPQIMFKPGGSWKEFGIGRGDTHTVIPFWLVAIFWAFISYGISLVILSNFANLAIAPFQSGIPALQMPQMYQQATAVNAATAATAATVATAANAANATTVAVNASTQPTIKPVSSMIGLEKNVPGYYVLSNNAQNGAPQYMYYGNSPPNISRY